MTSFTAPVSLYNLCSQTVCRERRYRADSAMNYIRQMSPLYTLLIQRAGWEDWFDSPDFRASCFIPNREYSSMHLDYFMENLDYETARELIRASVIPERITGRLLAGKEEIPTLGKLHEIWVDTSSCGRITVNGLCLAGEHSNEGWTVFTLNGLIHPGYLE